MINSLRGGLLLQLVCEGKGLRGYGHHVAYKRGMVFGVIGAARAAYKLFSSSDCCVTGVLINMTYIYPHSTFFRVSSGSKSGVCAFFSSVVCSFAVVCTFISLECI